MNRTATATAEVAAGGVIVLFVVAVIWELVA